MSEPLATRRWSGFVLPATVLLLLGLQFTLGFTGFGEPHGGILGLLEAPGALLGWGGVVILVILLSWLIAGLVGRDLFGLQGLSGLVVRLVGCVALGLALAGFLGLLGGAAGGGSVGAWLGGLLAGTVGTLVAGLLLLLMAVPAFVLAISPFFRSGPLKGEESASGAVSKDVLADLEPKPGLYEGTTYQAKPLYPERRYDETGAEIPLNFGGTDVGPVRFADEEPAEASEPAEPQPLDLPEFDGPLPEGVRFAGEEEPKEPEPPEAVDAGDRRIPLPNGVRFVGDEETDEEAETPEEDTAPDAPPDDDAEESEPEPESEPAEQRPVEDPVPEPEVTPEPPKRRASPRKGRPAPKVKGSDALDQLKTEDSGARYRAKLEDSGIFDEPPVPAAPEKETAEKQAAKKKTARKKVAKKKAAAKKKSAKAKAAPKKKAPAAKKKTTRKKATPKKKAAAAKKAPPKQEAAAAKEEEAPQARKGSAGVATKEVYEKAVSVAMERGAASSVLLSRRLGIGYAQARALIEALVSDGILGEMTPSGSRPLLIDQDEWEARNA